MTAYFTMTTNPLYLKFLGWFAMFLGMMSGASIGPMFKYLVNHHIAPLMAASWRCQCMLFFVIPLALMEARFTPTQWFETKPGLNYPVIVYILIAGLSWAGNLLSWISGLKYVSVVKASIIASLHPLILVFILYFTGESISSLEWIGTLISITGMVVSSGKGLYHMYHSEKTDEEAVNARLELYGLGLCLIAAVSESVVILNRSQIKKHVPLLQYTASTTFVVAALATFAAVITQPNPTSHIFCVEIDCLYGWTSHEWVGKMFIFAFVVGVLCCLGFNYAIVHISPLIFASIQLLDPVLTGIMVWIGGIEGIPDIYTWIGGFIIMSGVGLITLGEYKRSHKEDNLNLEAQMVKMKTLSGNKEEGNGGEDNEIMDDVETILLNDEEENSLFDDMNDTIESSTADLTLSHDSLPSSSSSSSYLNSCEIGNSTKSITPTFTLTSLWKGKDDLPQGSTTHDYSALPSLEVL